MPVSVYRSQDKGIFANSPDSGKAGPEDRTESLVPAYPCRERLQQIFVLLRNRSSRIEATQAHAAEWEASASMLTSFSHNLWHHYGL